MIRFILAFSVLVLPSVAIAIPSQDPEQVEQQQALQAVMDQTTAEMLKPGPRREGWDKGGFDLFQLVETAPGGAAQNYLLSVDKDGDRLITIVRAKDLSAVPKQWKSLQAVGSSEDIAESTSLTIANLDGPFYFAGWDSVRRVGDAYCSTGKLGGHLYESPSAAVGEIPREMISAFFAATVQMFEKHTVCLRYDREGDGFRISYFLEDGRTLPVLNDFKEKITIVPARDVDALLAVQEVGKP